MLRQLELTWQYPFLPFASEMAWSLQPIIVAKGRRVYEVAAHVACGHCE
jgi:hypothetical protein